MVKAQVIPVFWNKVDGRLNSFFFINNRNINNLVNIDIFKFIEKYVYNYENLKKREKNLLSQIYIGMITNLDKFDDISEIWKLVGWITPMSYDMIIYNNPMRELFDIKYMHMFLYENTIENKFGVFKECWEKVNMSTKNKKNILFNLPFDIICKIEEHLFKPYKIYLVY